MGRAEARTKAAGRDESRRLAASLGGCDEARRHRRAASRAGPFGGSMSTQSQASGESRRATHKADRGRKTPAAKSGNGSGSERLSLIGVKIDSTLRREIDAYAEAHGITRSRAAGHYLAIARETLRGREGVAAGKAEEILEALEGDRTVVERQGAPSCGQTRHTAHWST